MNSQTHDVEQQLCALYAAQLSHYEAALQVAETLPTAFDGGESSEMSLRQLAAALDQVAQSEAQIPALRKQWEALGQRPSPGMRKLLDRLQRTLERLIGLIGTAEQRAQQAKTRLTPEMDSATRRQQMLTAYTATINRT